MAIFNPNEALQIFRGGRPKLEMKISFGGAPATDGDRLTYDNRADRNNGHLRPYGFAEERHLFGGKLGLTGDMPAWEREDMLAHVKANGVGSRIAVFDIPAYAVLKYISVQTRVEEVGFTFDIETRNGLELPTTIARIDTTMTDCVMDRVKTTGTLTGLGTKPAATSPAIPLDRTVIAMHTDMTGLAVQPDQIEFVVARLPTKGFTGSGEYWVVVAYDWVASSYGDCCC